MTEYKIQTELRNKFDGHKYHLFNSYIYKWECDYFSISNSGYAYEVEVKLTKSDFKADFRKTDKHKKLDSRGKLTTFKGHDQSIYIKKSYAVELGLEISRWDKDKSNDQKISVINCTSINIKEARIPNRFYYACPFGLIDPKDIPDYAGLLYVNDLGIIEEVKNAPLLHKVKHDLTKVLLQKFYYKSLDLERDIIMMKQKERAF